MENAEIMGKSDVAATRLRYEQQVKNLHDELNSIQVQNKLNPKAEDMSMSNGSLNHFFYFRNNVNVLNVTETRLKNF